MVFSCSRYFVLCQHNDWATKLWKKKNQMQTKVDVLMISGFGPGPQMMFLGVISAGF
jgi:hypothetical protein